MLHDTKINCSYIFDTKKDVYIVCLIKMLKRHFPSGKTKKRDKKTKAGNQTRCRTRRITKIPTLENFQVEKERTASRGKEMTAASRGKRF
jgi:hypothetical protein